MCDRKIYQKLNFMFVAYWRKFILSFNDGYYQQNRNKE